MPKDEIKQSDPTYDTHWRTARADKFSLIVDADGYYRVLRQLFLNARHEMLMIGWDFDFEIEMLPGESDDVGNAPDGYPNKLGAFLAAVAAASPDLNIYMLKWNGAVLVAPGRFIPSVALSMFGSDQIHLALDGHHPFGACHHQKIVVCDNSFAFCGGIDVTEMRWDTSDHLPDDPRRVRKDGTLSEPWHDATSAMCGSAAAALGELSRQRWFRATGTELDLPPNRNDLHWPDELPVDVRDVDVMISRTEPPFDGRPLINEIEEHYLSSIATAQKWIYIESQYFAADTICDALEVRLQEADGPEVVIINPIAAMSAFEDDAMHVTRARMLSRLQAADHEDRLRVYYPVTKAEEPIYVHAKIFIGDDNILRIGSSNLSNRSMGFDTECDVAVIDQPDLTAAFRTRLLSEHLGVSEDSFDARWKETCSIIETINALNNNSGRGLRDVDRNPDNWRGNLLADTQFMDPRYLPGQDTSTGQGARPRHLAMAATVLAAAGLAWMWFRR